MSLETGSAFVAAPATAQAVEPVPIPAPIVNVAVVNDGPSVEPVSNIYHPMVAVSRKPGPPASPYAAALSYALADCAGTTLNQVCYAGGSVTLDGGESQPLTLTISKELHSIYLPAVIR